MSLSYATLTQHQLFNRVFIIGGKDVTEKQWKDAFSEFGQIIDVLITKNRHTSEKKGVTYITYTKTSEACLACEKMNGQVFPESSDTRRLKVLIANQRGESNKNRPDNEEMMLARLFIKTPDGSTDKEIREYFQTWGEVDHVKVLYDKASGRSKNLAFVRYFSQYNAAMALESCDQEVYRPKFADCEQRRDGPSDRDGPHDRHSDRYSDRPSYNDRSSFGSNDRNFAQEWADYYAHAYDYYGTPGAPDQRFGSGGGSVGAPPPPEIGKSRDLISSYPHNSIMALELQVPMGLTQEHMFKLFDIIPGLQSCHVDVTRGVGIIRYETPQQAAYAKDKITGMEYPPGHQLVVQYHMGSGSTNVDVQALMETIQKATEALAQAGHANISSSAPSLPPASSNMVGYERVSWCSAPLPPRKPMASKDEPCDQRLFIVSHKSFNERYLEDAFCRFGNMQGAYFVPGRNYGYVKYTSKDSAQKALEYLHGQELCDNKMKVIWADPPRDNGEGFGPTGSKRQRSD